MGAGSSDHCENILDVSVSDYAVENIYKDMYL